MIVSLCVFSLYVSLCACVGCVFVSACCAQTMGEAWIQVIIFGMWELIFVALICVGSDVDDGWFGGWSGSALPCVSLCVRHMKYIIEELFAAPCRWVDAKLAPRLGEAAGRGSCSLQFELSALVTSLAWGGSFPLLSRSCRNEPALGGLGDAVAGLSDVSRGRHPTTTTTKRQDNINATTR